MPEDIGSATQGAKGAVGKSGSGLGLGLWPAHGRVWLSQGSVVQGQLAGAGGGNGYGGGKDDSGLR